jgi:tetratricopeptide (TPR) repeat protein
VRPGELLDLQMHDDLARVSALMGEEQWEAAIELIERLPEAARDKNLNWNHGWALFKLGRLEPAAASLCRCVLQDPAHAASHWALGVILSERDDLESAEKHFLTALGLKDSGLTRLTLALVYMKQGRLTDAERIHIEGLERKPNNRFRVEAYADFLSDCGREAEAQAQYARAQSLPER